MIAHQLDLFGGPLKPPKKIKVDDEDIPVDDPKVAELPVPEPDPITDELNNGEEIIQEALPHEPEAFSDEEVVTNDIEWSEGIDDQAVEEILESPAGEPEEISSETPVITGNGEDEAPLSEEEDAPSFTNEAIFTAEINDDNQEPGAIPQIIEEEQAAETKAQDEEPGLSIATTNVQRLKKAEEEDGLNIPADEELFKRQYYSMRETAAMFGVNQSLLRFWENEFDILQPKKNKKGDRYFRPVDIKNLVLIFHLLRIRKFTLEGAKDYLNSHKKAADSFELVRRLEKLKSFLFELKAGL